MTALLFAILNLCPWRRLDIPGPFLLNRSSVDSAMTDVKKIGRLHKLALCQLGWPDEFFLVFSAVFVTGNAEKLREVRAILADGHPIALESHSLDRELPKKSSF
jgi:hypothetical protein